MTPLDQVPWSPAPWKVIGNNGYCVWSGDNIIATMAAPRIRAKIAHADALLMAAAPELYEALSAMEAIARRDNWDLSAHYSTTYAMAREALAKARGEA